MTARRRLSIALALPVLLSEDSVSESDCHFPYPPGVVSRGQCF